MAITWPRATALPGMAYILCTRPPIVTDSVACRSGATVTSPLNVGLLATLVALDTASTSAFTESFSSTSFFSSFAISSPVFTSLLFPQEAIAIDAANLKEVVQVFPMTGKTF